MAPTQNYEIPLTHLKNNQFISAHNQFLNLAENIKKSDLLKSALLFMLAAECKKRQGKESKEEIEEAGKLFLKYGESKKSLNTKGALLCASKCFLKIGDFDEAKKAYEKAKKTKSQKVEFMRPVVIIDDSKAISLKLKTYVEKLGFTEIHIFEDGKSALKGCKEILSSKTLPIILLDMGLPDIDGDKVATQLLEQQINLQIIVITADEKTTKRVSKTISSGVSGFIQKPFTLDEVKNAIDVAESEYILQQ